MVVQQVLVPRSVIDLRVAVRNQPAGAARLSRDEWDPVEEARSTVSHGGDQPDYLETTQEVPAGSGCGYKPSIRAVGKRKAKRQMNHLEFQIA